MVVDSTIISGLDFGLWTAGQDAFGACIWIVSLTLLRNHNNFTGWGEFILFLAVFQFYPTLWLLTLPSWIPNLYGLWPTYVDLPTNWFALILVCASVFTIDFIVQYLVASLLPNWMDQVKVKGLTCVFEDSEEKESSNN